MAKTVLSYLCSAMLFLVFSAPVEADWRDVPDAGEGECVSGCGDDGGSSGSGGGRGLIWRLFHGSDDEDVYQPSPQEIATEHNNSGVSLYEAGNYGAALGQFEEAYRLNPGSEVVRRNLANTLAQIAAKTDDPEEGRRLLKRAKDLAPGESAIGERLNTAEERVADQERMGRAKAKIDRMLDDFATQFATPSAPVQAPGSSGSTPTGDPNVVDLTFLDPSEPIVVDPGVVKGNPRTSAVQPAGDPRKNANYKGGFEALKNRDPAAAIALFEKAGKELPGDPLVKYALLLAQDLKGVKDRENRTEARQSAAEAIRALQQSDTARAVELLRESGEKDPSDANIRETLRYVESLHAEAGAAKREEAVGEAQARQEIAAAQKDEAAIVGALGARALIEGDRKGAAAILNREAEASPDNPEIGKLRKHVVLKPGEDDTWTGEINYSDEQDWGGKQRIVQDEKFEDASHQMTIRTVHEDGVTTQTVTNIDKSTGEVITETSDDRPQPKPAPTQGGGLDFMR